MQGWMIQKQLVRTSIGSFHSFWTSFHVLNPLLLPLSTTYASSSSSLNSSSTVARSSALMFAPKKPGPAPCHQTQKHTHPDSSNVYRFHSPKINHPSSVYNPNHSPHPDRANHKESRPKDETRWAGYLRGITASGVSLPPLPLLPHGPQLSKRASKEEKDTKKRRRKSRS